MEAFIDSRMLIISIIMIVIIMAFILIDTKENHLFSILGILFLLIINFYVARNDYETSKENIEYFKNNKKLNCHNDNSAYRVLNNKEWSIDGNYFIKNSLMIRADKCEVVK